MRSGTTMKSRTIGVRHALEAANKSAATTASSRLPRADGRAFHEFMPLRPGTTHPGHVYRKISYGPLLDVFVLDMRSTVPSQREDGTANRSWARRSVAWLKRELMHSRATWKVIAADLPIGVVSDDAVVHGNGRARAGANAKSPTCSPLSGMPVSANTVWHPPTCRLHRGLLP